uniref:Uncharacterized protein n=1 Tax=Plectus sambesii TaxID=2011161 RepID=A0A914WHM4_9BILA
MDLNGKADMDGTCGNGLQCPAKSFMQVDCYETVLYGGGRCLYTFDSSVYVWFILITFLATSLLLCYLYHANFDLKDLLSSKKKRVKTSKLIDVT